MPSGCGNVLGMSSPRCDPGVVAFHGPTTRHRPPPICDTAAGRTRAPLSPSRRHQLSPGGAPAAPAAASGLRASRSSAPGSWSCTRRRAAGCRPAGAAVRAASRSSPRCCGAAGEFPSYVVTPRCGPGDGPWSTSTAAASCPGSTFHLPYSRASRPRSRPGSCCRTTRSRPSTPGRDSTSRSPTWSPGGPPTPRSWCWRATPRVAATRSPSH